MKVAIIGAGNVGAMTASRIVDAGLADVVLMDIVPGLAKGKALDISDARPIFNSKVNICGTEKFQDIQDSGIVIITAGFARKIGMSRDDLLQRNSAILKDISLQIKEYCTSSIVIVVTNPLDVMSYLVMKTTGFNPSKVIGMAGVLDTARFINILSEKSIAVKDEEIFMMGSHGDTMVPINRSRRIPADIFEQIVRRAKDRGAEILKYLQTGSAYFAPSTAVFFMAKAILKNEKRKMCVSAYLSGEYGEKDVYIGVPVILDASGVRKIIEIKLTDQERASFQNSAQQIREGIKKCSM